MLSDRQFHRSFIILKAQDSGFHLHSGKEPAGYVKMEIKKSQGKMQLYIQDMKPAQPQQAIYDVVLVSTKQEVEPIKLTSIQVPDKGRGEYEIAFDPDDVGESKYSIGEYHALAVVERQRNNNQTLRYPLVGYSDKRVELDWTHEVTRGLRRMYQTLREKRTADLSSPETEEEENPTMETETAHHDEEAEGLQEMTTGDDSESLKEESDDALEARDLYSMQLGSASYWSRVEEYYSRLFDNHKKVTPFDDSSGEVDWIRVENFHELLYPQYRAYDPYDPYRRNGGALDHYLIGLVRNQGKVQYVVYGIPGIYSAAPPMSMHGFSRWLPVKNGYGAGYWLLYIDALTGNIAYPY
ncbi:MAG: hypothetical protein ACOX25_04785 [Caldicoprobacterales bacterium]|nr:hypothetical protein [Clostridiales bacterium]